MNQVDRKRGARMKTLAVPKTIDRFEALDGMRGLAALAVLGFHSGPLFPGLCPFPRGYLAVDFFFMLSGFVLAHAYEGRLCHSGTLWPFIRLRLIRLYPLLFLGTAIGIGVYIIRLHINGQDIRGGDVAVILFSLFALPAIWTAPFPINPPIWSLFWEIVVNLLFAALIRYMDSIRLTVIMLLLWLSLIATAWIHRDWLHLGTSRDLWWAGFLRAAALFSMGVLLLRIHRRLRWSPSCRRTWTGPLLLLPMIAPPLPSPQNVLFDAACALLLFPILLLTAARSRPRWPELSRLAGTLSYPLYATHMPLLLLAGGIVTHVLGKGAGETAQSMAAAFIVTFVLLFATLVHIFWDIPVRRLVTGIGAKNSSLLPA